MNGGQSFNCFPLCSGRRPQSDFTIRSSIFFKEPYFLPIRVSTGQMTHVVSPSLGSTTPKHYPPLVWVFFSKHFILTIHLPPQTECSTTQSYTQQRSTRTRISSIEMRITFPAASPQHCRNSLANTQLGGCFYKKEVTHPLL